MTFFGWETYRNYEIDEKTGMMKFSFGIRRVQ